MYERLFSTGRIGRIEIKNRVVMTPMGTVIAAPGEASTTTSSPTMRRGLKVVSVLSRVSSAVCSMVLERP